MPPAARACTLLLLLLALAPAAQAAPVHFTPPLLVDDTRAGGEPVMWTDPMHKVIVYSSHAGTTHLYKPGLVSGGALDFISTYRNQVFMWRSEDDGRTFKRIDYAGGFATDPTKNSGFSDPDFTQDAGGRIYNTGINLANTALFSSPDGGKTWDAGTVQCVPGDRPWLAGGRKDEVFLADNVLNSGGGPTHQVFQSTDAGNTCPATGIPAGGTTEAGEDWTGNGKILYDRATDTVVEPANFMGGSGGVTGVGIDTWTREDKAFKPSKAADSSMFAHWPAISIDDGGTLYEVWDDAPVSETENGGCNGAPSPLANHILMAYTKDFGKTWSKPIKIAAPANHRVFWPWVAAGEAGRVSVVWYETDKVADIGCVRLKLSIKAATILRATSAHRKVTVVDPVGRPIADSDLCLSGTTCVATGEDRRLGDFFTNSVGLDGCVEIASGRHHDEGPGDRRRAAHVTAHLPAPGQRPSTARQRGLLGQGGPGRRSRAAGIEPLPVAPAFPHPSARAAQDQAAQRSRVRRRQARQGAPPAWPPGRHRQPAGQGQGPLRRPHRRAHRQRPRDPVQARLPHLRLISSSWRPATRSPDAR